MLKKVIKYEDYDGNPQEFEAYFDLSKMELTDLNLEYEEYDGILGYMKKLMQERNGFIKKPAIDFMRRLLDTAYGIRPKDNPSKFIKVDENGEPLIKQFKGTIPYDEYLYQLITEQDVLEEFGAYAMPKISDEQRAESEEILKKEGFIDAAGEVTEFPVQKA